MRSEREREREFVEVKKSAAVNRRKGHVYDGNADYILWESNNLIMLSFGWID